MAAALRRGLRAHGIVTDVATTGSDALWMARSTPFDAVVLDVMLAEIDGFEVCRPGFPPRLHGRAFDRFTRDDSARRRGGAGLGLAIVRAVARAHRGDAEVVPGDGGCVRIRLPSA